jgi:hypothetical protein
MPKRATLPKDQAGWTTLADQLLQGRDDRAAVVLGGAFVEAVLDSVIESWVLPGVNLRFLSHFGAKKDFAHALALIDDEELEHLEAIANIRNLFAHELLDATFKHPKVRTSLSVLKRTTPSVDPGDSGRTCFNKAVVGAVTLRLRVREPVTREAFRREMQERMKTDLAKFTREYFARGHHRQKA